MNLKPFVLPAALLLVLGIPAISFAQTPQQQDAAAEAAANAAISDPQVPPAAPMPLTATLQGNVTVTSSPGNSIVGDYKIDFDAMDANHNGWISMAEARSNATLTAEFEAVDNNHDRKLTRDELKGWM